MKIDQGAKLMKPRGRACVPAKIQLKESITIQKSFYLQSIRIHFAGQAAAEMSHELQSLLVHQIPALLHARTPNTRQKVWSLSILYI